MESIILHILFYVILVFFPNIYVNTKHIYVNNRHGFIEELFFLSAEYDNRTFLFPANDLHAVWGNINCTNIR